MPTSYLTGETTKLFVGNGATPTEVFTEVAQLVSIDGPQLSKEAVKRSVLGATPHRHRPSKKLNSNEVSVTIQWDPENAQHTQFITDVLGTSATRNWKIAYDNGTNTWPGWLVPAWVKSVNPTGVEEDNQVQLEVVLQVDGPVAQTTVTIS